MFQLRFFRRFATTTAMAATTPNNAKYGAKIANLLTSSMKPPTGAPTSTIGSILARILKLPA